MAHCLYYIYIHGDAQGSTGNPENSMTKISKRASFVVVADGRIVSGHIEPATARAAAQKVAGVAVSVPIVAAGFAPITLAIGQRVRVNAGMAIPA